MKKLLSIVILTVFASAYVVGAAASDASNDAKKEKWEEEYGHGGHGNTSTSEIMEDNEPRDVSPDEKYKYRDQEVMDKKPYKD